LLYNILLQRKKRQNKAVHKKIINKKTVKWHYNLYSIEQKKQIILYIKENGIIIKAKSFKLDKDIISC
jgi:hypothetical protein